MITAISKHTGVAYASVSFILAVAQLSFGITQPLFGIVALKKSNAFVLEVGAALLAIGLMLIPASHYYCFSAFAENIRCYLRICDHAWAHRCIYCTTDFGNYRKAVRHCKVGCLVWYRIPVSSGWRILKFLDRRHRRDHQQ